MQQRHRRGDFEPSRGGQRRRRSIGLQSSGRASSCVDNRPQTRSTSDTIWSGETALAVDDDPFFKPIKMGRRVEAGAITGGREDRGRHRGGGTFSFGPGDMDRRIFLMRIAEPAEQFVHPVEAKIAGWIRGGSRPFVIDAAQQELHGFVIAGRQRRLGPRGQGNGVHTISRQRDAAAKSANVIPARRIATEEEARGRVAGTTRDGVLHWAAQSAASNLLRREILLAAQPQDEAG